MPPPPEVWVVAVRSAENRGPVPQASVEPARKWYVVPAASPVTVNEWEVVSVAFETTEP